MLNHSYRAVTCALLAILAIVFVSILVPLSAEAKAPKCEYVSSKSAICSLKVKTPSSPSKSSKGGGGKSATSSHSSGGGSRTCQYHGKDIPCNTSDGSWYADQGCYAKAAGGEIGDVAVAAAGYSMATCRSPGNPVPIDIAVPNNALGGPAAPPPPPDPAVLAQQALAQMGLHAIEIGIVPKPGPNSVGLVGMPTWMWVADPGESTTGPITRSVSKDNYTVTAEGRVSRIVWRMGDGHSVVCKGEGTPYEDAYGKRRSPTCGHVFSRQGAYAVSATSYWQVVWAGIGQTGVFNLQFTQQVQIQVGEAQVIVR